MATLENLFRKMDNLDAAGLHHKAAAVLDYLSARGFSRVVAGRDEYFQISGFPMPGNTLMLDGSAERVEQLCTIHRLAA